MLLEAGIDAQHVTIIFSFNNYFQSASKQELKHDPT